MKLKQSPLTGPTLLSRGSNVVAKGACVFLMAALLFSLGTVGGKQIYLSTKSEEFRQLYSMEMMSDERASDMGLTKDILGAANEAGVSEVNFWKGPMDGTETECLLLAIPMTAEQQDTEMTYTKVSYEFDEGEKDFKKIRQSERVCAADYLRLTIADLMSDYIADTGNDSINFQVTANDTGIIAMLGKETGKFITNLAYVMENYGDESMAAQFELLKDSFDHPAAEV